MRFILNLSAILNKNYLNLKEKQLSNHKRLFNFLKSFQILTKIDSSYIVKWSSIKREKTMNIQDQVIDNNKNEFK